MATLCSTLLALAFPSQHRGVVELKSSDYTTITMYRVQGSTWVNNLLNTDAADASGLAYFLDKFNPEARYADPVVAMYSVDANALDNRTGTGIGYAECADCKGEDTQTCPVEAPPRNCTGGDPQRVGVQAAPGGGNWYSLPGAGACKPDGIIGYDCYWRVRAIRKVVTLSCLRQNGCAKENCVAQDLTHAFSACGDLGNASHYGDPNAGCLVDERLNDEYGGAFCSPPCLEGNTYCPPDVPTGVTAKPKCMVHDPIGNGMHCALSCSSNAQCGSNGRCSKAFGPSSGFCVATLKSPEIKLVYGTACPAGWTASTNLSGFVPAFAPSGGKGGTTNGEPALRANETGRVGPHGHKVDDPGHSHNARFAPYVVSGDKVKKGTATGPGGSCKSCKIDPVGVTVDSATSGISVQPLTGSHYPLAYVLACVRK